MARALVVGEALIDVIHTPDGEVREHVGGSPANVALALARLGREVDLLTWLGHDLYGDRIRRQLSRYGVTIQGGSVSAYATPFAIARTDESGHTSYEFDVTWDMPDPESIPADPLVLHIGSLGTAIQPGAKKVSALVARLHGGATITYDPNIRPSLMGDRVRMRPIVESYLAAADIVKASEDDLLWLEPGMKAEFTIANWARRGPALAVLTKGGGGITALTNTGDRIDLPAMPVDVVDTVGAGDSFLGALIDGLWEAGLLGGANRQKLRDASGDVFEPILARAVVAAAITCSRPGADPPTRDDVRAAQPPEPSDAAHTTATPPTSSGNASSNRS